MKMSYLKSALIILLLLFVMIVIIQNTDNVSTRIIFFDINMPRAAWIFVTMCIGYILGILTSIRFRRKMKQKTDKSKPLEKEDQ